MDLYSHFPVRLHGVALNLLSTGTTLPYYNKKKKFYRRYKKRDSETYDRKLVKSTIKCDRLTLLKSIVDNLKYQPRQSWNYVAKFRKNTDSLSQFQVGSTRLPEPNKLPNAFLKHLQVLYNNTPPGVMKSALSQCNDTFILQLFFLIMTMFAKQSKDCGKRNLPGLVVGILSFVVKIYSDIFALSLTLLSTLVCSRRLRCCMKTSIVKGFTKGNRASVNNYRPIAILSVSSKVFEFVIHGRFPIILSHIKF
jgi:hypothetical protein